MSESQALTVDAHQHFWVYNPREYEWIDSSMQRLRRDFLPRDLEPELKANGMSGCVAVQVRQTAEETRWLLQLADQSPFIVGVVGWVDLRLPEARSQIKVLAAHPKLVGVRHIVQSEADDRFLLQPNFLRGVSYLEESDLAYDILIYPKHLAVACDFVARFPRQRFVLDHLAKPAIKAGMFAGWIEDFRRLAGFPNVYCKLSGMVTEAAWTDWQPTQMEQYMDAAFECFGPSRLMIGSDWPVCALAASYTQTLSVVRDYIRRFSPEIQAGIMGHNAREFWKLNSRV